VILYSVYSVNPESVSLPVQRGAILQLLKHPLKYVQTITHTHT